MQILNILDVVGGKNILAGAPAGRNLLSQLIPTVKKMNEPTLLFLDFSEIEIATASFLRASIIGFRDYCIGSELNVIPIVANAREEIIEELILVLEAKGDALVICTLKNDEPSEPKVIGILEDKQIVTLNTVFHEKEVNAVELEKKYWEQEKIKATGWNNRLVSLVLKGILLEIKRGRQKYYRSVLEVNYGS